MIMRQTALQVQLQVECCDADIMRICEAWGVLHAACTADGNGITYNERINVALAVAMPDGGLITPVIKDADTTDIYQVSRTLHLNPLEAVLGPVLAKILLYER